LRNFEKLESGQTSADFASAANLKPEACIFLNENHHLRSQDFGSRRGKGC